MRAKTREYYLTTSSSRDFTWFFFKPPVTTRPVKRKADPLPPRKVTAARRGELSSIAEKPGQALMAPADVKAMARAARTRPEPAKPKTTKSGKASTKNAGPWSDWYVSEGCNYFWRARQLQNETWDYQFGHQEAPQAQDTTPSTSSSQLSQPLSAISEQPPVSPSPIPPVDPTSPKSSWPTIVTTSTGYPTEGFSASSSRIPMTLPEEVDDPHQLYPADTGVIPFVATAKPASPRGNIKSSSKRPVGPVMRLFQEGRSRKSKAKTQATKSTANDTTTFLKGAAGANTRQEINASQNLVQPANRTTSALAKKLHARIKSEKELKVDPKKRVKTWLKGVELDLAPIPLDAQGFPIYR